MLSGVVLACFAASQAPAVAVPLDVSSLKIGAPTVVVEVDTGKLKGDLRRLAWAPDGDSLYLQTAEGNPPLEKLHHYTVAVKGGPVTAVEQEPEWAARYWQIKQDRIAPGLPSLVIDVKQGQETIKTGTGPSGVLDRTIDPAGAPNPTPDNLAQGTMGNQKANVVRLQLLGEDIGVWRNERVIPGTKFGWGPAGSGSLVFVDEEGRLVFFDQQKHRKTVSGARDVLLPAWSADGARLAYLEKAGRKKYALMWVPVEQ